MRAARVHSWGAPPVIEDIPVPEAREGQTLLEVQAAGVGHLDLTIAGGQFGRPPALPYTPGVECVGKVVESTVHAVGDRMLLRGGGPGMTGDGCWAEYVVAPDRALVAVPEGLSASLGAVFATPTSTAWVALHDVGEVSREDHLVVTGAAGAVGSAVVQLALEAEVASVTGVVGREAHAAHVPTGAKVVVGRGAKAAAALDSPADLLVDTVGGDGLRELLASVAAGGRAALVGYTAGTRLTLDLPSWLLSDVTLRPVNLMRRPDRARDLLPRLAERLVDGRLSLAVEEVALADAASAMSRLQRGDVAGRLALLP